MSKRNSADNQPQPASLAQMFNDGHPAMEDADVQPLFDPKLPPSANSDFKPNIGVVATHANDLQELRHLYPQLNLMIVQAEAVSDVRRFGHCQRIIALRDEIPPDMDELLSRLLRHRYVRQGGGVRGLKEQLNAWLDAPGSITSAPKRAVPCYGKEPYGDMAKKKPNRYPRLLGR
jgi:hypothetical protein